MQRSLECPVCTEVYNTTTKVPKSLSCGHGFCATCLGTLLKGSTLNCPKCRKICDVPESRVDKLPTNFALLELLESLCEECRDMPHTGRCDHCSQNLCDVCSRTHPEVAGSYGIAEFSVLEQLLTELHLKYCDRNLDEIAPRDQELFDGINEARQQLHEKVNRLCDNLESEVKLKIHQRAERHLEWLGKMETELLNVKMFIRMSKLQLKDGDREAMIREIREQSRDKNTTLRSCLRSKPRDSEISLVCEMQDLDKALLKCCRIASAIFPDYRNVSFKSICDSDVLRPEFICEHGDTGNILVTDSWSHKLCVFDQKLNHLCEFGQGREDNFLQGVAINSDGHIFIVDLKSHSIKVVNMKGRELYTLGLRGDLYTYPRGLAIDSQDLMYVCNSYNHTVKVTDKHGTILRDFGLNVIDDEPRSISVHEYGRVAVTDYSGHMYLFTTDGDHIRTVHGEVPPHNIGFGVIAFDKHCNIVATDYKNHRLVVMNPEGDIIFFIGQEGSGPGDLLQPSGVAVTKRGDIVVCDTGNHRIQLFSVPSVSM